MTEMYPLTCFLRFGTRGSPLAQVQTDHVLQRLAAIAPAVRTTTVVIRTEGDIDKTSPLTEIGGRGVFTTALQDALWSGLIDVAVHSAKDLPSERPPALQLIAFPEREDPRDVLVSRHQVPLAQLPPQPTIGTSSRRRALQVRLQRPDARIVDLRGNVDTRLRKALETEIDGIVIAAAGVRRMGWSDRITEELSLATFVPSPGQGALAIEVRTADAELALLLAPLNDVDISRAVRVERAFLRAAGGGCTSPIGAHATMSGGHLVLRAMLASEDGERIAWAHEPLDADRTEEHATEIGLCLQSRVLVDAPRLRPTAASPKMQTRSNGHQSERPLAGVSVLVTRAWTQAGELMAALHAAGAEPLLLPTIKLEAPVDAAPLHDAIRDLAAGEYDWIVFTSANAVRRLLASPGWPGADQAAWRKTRIAAVGRSTTKAITMAGLHVDLTPSRADALALSEAMIARSIDGKRVLYPKADIARATLPDTLKAAGARVDAVDAYRTVPETEIARAVMERLLGGEIDIVTFASPSSVRYLRSALGDQFPTLHHTSIVCVGPVTAAAAREVGLDVDLVAVDASVIGLVETIVRARRDRDSSLTAVSAKSPGNAAAEPWQKERP
ncbi:MAG: hydroxymethylbilane synthase [Chloroflexota bacterium]|nr:hydroxymethylbilane synthase [Chloroflexota bacterium]